MRAVSYKLVMHFGLRDILVMPIWASIQRQAQIICSNACLGNPVLLKIGIAMGKAPPRGVLAFCMTMGALMPAEKTILTAKQERKQATCTMSPL